ncbi:MAG: hypothetical protein Q8Q18_01095 [bacterium]|nr:hypothetical protein [bacterium]
MASKLNSEFNYRYQVQGETIWEKIKTLKNFLVGRKRAVALEEVQMLKTKAKISKLEYLKKNGGLEHEILELEADIIEVKSFEEDQKECWDLNRQEIDIIEKLLGEAYEIAEKTRIPEYTDEQMFEANAANEFTAMIGKEIYAEIIANGRPSPAKVRNAMSNPITWDALTKAGLIPKGNEILLCSDDPTKVEVKLLGEVKLMV